MAGMDEYQLQESVSMYSLQLEQVQSAIVSGAGDQNPELLTLRDDLKQLLDLTEDALLNLKKSKLLASLESSDCPDENQFQECRQPTTEDSGHDLDSEFASFQAAIEDDLHGADKPNHTDNSRDMKASCDDDDDDDDNDDDSSDSNGEDGSLEDIAGTKCTVPFSHDWGEKRHHAAMILCTELKDMEASVRVLFCHPTHLSMVPCPFYLDGKCRFTDDKCRYSHGFVVPVSELKTYTEPDHSSLLLESRCLARDGDGVWYSAVVVETANEDHQLQVMFDANHDTVQLGLEDVVPWAGENDGDAEASEDDDEEEDAPTTAAVSDESDDNDDNALPVFLWRPSQTTNVLGDWEAHTRGIASKLMGKMGYVMGEGLGCRGDGRAEPVPIQLLPQGKSLDKIMELKEIAGDRDLYDVMKKEKRKQRITEKQNSTVYDQIKKREKSSVFDFINKKLHGKKGNIHSLVRHVQGNRTQASISHISEKDLGAKSDRHINIQHLKTADEIKKTEKEVNRLKESLDRSQSSRDKSMVAHYRQKLSSTESYLTQLQTSQSSIEKHKASRKQHKKLMVF